MGNEDIQIVKHSDTEVVVTRQVPQQEISQIQSKTDVINRIEYIKTAKKDTEKILAERLQAFDKEIEELQIILNRMDADGIKTDYEVAEEARIAEEKRLKIEQEIAEKEKQKQAEEQVQTEVPVTDGGVI